MKLALNLTVKEWLKYLLSKIKLYRIEEKMLKGAEKFMLNMDHMLT